MNREEELLVLRASSLAFGVFAQMKDANGDRIVRSGGSGIFISPFRALTARHVTRDFFSIDETRADQLNKRVRAAEENANTDYFELPHSSVLFQAQLGRVPRPLLWHVSRVWDSPITDISLMEVFADGDEAAGNERKMSGFFEWSLLPPPVGSRVITLGYPLTNVTTKNDLINIDLKYVLQEGCVTDIYELRRERGMYSFPCFRIDKPVNHGFSGGPVFWSGKLCGIISGGLDDAHVASLWPLCLLKYEYRDMGALGGEKNFADLFVSGELLSEEWPLIKNRISKRYDEDGKAYAYIQS